MKTLGLLGGMSWESTVTYYQVINETAKQRLGGLHSAKCLLYSVDFAEVEALMQAGDWEGIGERLAEQARRLERAGAGLLGICTNTVHKVADQIAAAVDIPLLHIADAAADALKAAGVGTALLLGTRPTMEEDFVAGRIRERGIRLLTPNVTERAELHRIIFAELCLGEIREDSRAFMAGVIARGQSEGAAGVILGCTELGLSIRAEDTPLPLFDTALLHARALADAALEG